MSDVRSEASDYKLCLPLIISRIEFQPSLHALTPTFFRIMHQFDP